MGGFISYPHGLIENMYDSPGIGNVYFVCQSAQGAVYDRLVERFKGSYPDGSPILSADIASALSYCVAERNDYVLLMPDNDDYNIATGLNITAKSTHLICPANLGPSIGTMNNCRIHVSAEAGSSFAADHTIKIKGGGIEVGGLYLKAAAGKYCINIPGTGAGATSPFGLWIHHNVLNSYTASSADGGIVGTITDAYIDGGGYSVIEYNKNHNTYSSNTSLAGILIQAGAAHAVIKKNLIIVANTCTMTTAIECTANPSAILDNDIMMCVGSTISIGIRCGNNTAVMGNRIGIDSSGNSIDGGTAARNFVLNYDSTTAGGTLLNG